MLVVFCSGCAASLHPLASNDVSSETPNLVGRWQVTEPRDSPVLKPGTRCIVKHFGKGMYAVQIDTVDGKSTEWDASVVKLGDLLYLDVQPGLKELKGRPEEFLATRLHGIFVLDVDGDQARLIGFHQNNLHETARQTGVATMAGPGSRNNFLAAETPALQEFFRKHGAGLAQRDSKGIVLKRTPAKTTP